jgi:KDO2-lipid IV(A) lauroyltransferase
LSLRRIALEIPDRAATALLRCVIALLGWVPHRTGLVFARGLADLLFALGLRRRVLMANLDHVYADQRSQREKRRIARSANRNLFMTVYEMLRASNPRASAEVAGYMTLHPPELAHSMSSEAPGLMAAVAHSGNVDLCGLRWAHSYSRPIAVVMKRLKGERLSALLVEARERYGFGVLRTRDTGTMRAAQQRIRDGELVCILPDQYARGRGVVVDFLGRPASTHKGAAIAALESPGCRIIVAIDTRIDDGPRHVCHLREIRDFQPSGDRERDVHDLTQRICDVMSEVIWKHPESYLWHHRRWGYPGSDVRS